MRILDTVSARQSPNATSTAPRSTSWLLTTASPAETVAAILGQQGVIIRYRLLDEATVTAAAKLYAEGFSLAAVAARLNVSTKTIHNAFRAAGITTRSWYHQWS